MSIRYPNHGNALTSYPLRVRLSSKPDFEVLQKNSVHFYLQYRVAASKVCHLSELLSRFYGPQNRVSQFQKLVPRSPIFHLCPSWKLGEILPGVLPQGIARRTAWEFAPRIAPTYCLVYCPENCAEVLSGEVLVLCAGDVRWSCASQSRNKTPLRPQQLAILSIFGDGKSSGLTSGDITGASSDVTTARSLCPLGCTLAQSSSRRHWVRKCVMVCKCFCVFLMYDFCDTMTYIAECLNGCVSRIPVTELTVECLHDLTDVEVRKRDFTTSKKTKGGQAPQMF